MDFPFIQLKLLETLASCLLKHAFSFIVSETKAVSSLCQAKNTEKGKQQVWSGLSLLDIKQKV